MHPHWIEKVETPTRRASRPARMVWLALAFVLFVAGFTLDGTTEVGHHAALIVGGIVVGLGIRG